MTLTPEPARSDSAGPEAPGEPISAEQRRATMLEQLIEMRRDEAAAEDAEDFGWAEDLRGHPFRPRLPGDHEKPGPTT